MSHDRWKTRNPIAEVYSRNRLIEFVKKYQDRINPSSGTPGGSDTQIQYNSAGSFGGASGFLWEGTHLMLTGTTSIRFSDSTRLIQAVEDSTNLNIKNTAGDLDFSCGGDQISWRDGGDNVYGQFSNADGATKWIFKDSTFTEVMVIDGNASALTASTELYVSGNLIASSSVGIGTTAPEAYLDIKNTVDDGATNRTMLRLHNYRSDDADVNDFGPISIDFEIENVAGGAKSGIARIAAVQSPVGTDHSTILGEKSSGLIFSTMYEDTLAEAMRIDAEGHVGIDIDAPKTHLDVSHGGLDWLAADTGGGESVIFGTGTTTAGKLYYLNTSAVWTEADADAVASGATQLLGIALGTNPATDGMLVRGFFKMSSYLVLGGVAFSASRGKPVYVSTTAANGDVNAPSATGDFVRLIGYCTAETDVVYFNPSSTYIEIS